MVKERELDIATVPLALVAEQYFAYIAAMEVLDVEIAADYLVIAATLVFLKSKSLLAADSGRNFKASEETAEEVEERLREQAHRVLAIQGRAEQLRSRRKMPPHAYFYRDAGDPGAPLIQRYSIAAPKLARRAPGRGVRNRETRKTHDHARACFDRAQMEFVMQRVRDEGRTSFFGSAAGSIAAA